MRLVTITEMETYERLYASIKKASEVEQLLRDTGSEHAAARDAIKLLDDLAANDLPDSMGKLISKLELQSQFQSLGRYVRSFTDAEFVIRNLREQILSRLNDHEVVAAAINKLIHCSESITRQLTNQTLSFIP